MALDNQPTPQEQLGDSPSIDIAGIESSQALTWCHREYRPARLVSVGNWLDLIAVLTVAILPFAVWLFVGYLGNFPALWSGGVFLLLSACVLLNPAVWVILSFGLNTFSKPRSVRITQRGLEVRRWFGAWRQVSWKQVRVKLDKHGNVTVWIPGYYKFAIRGDYEKFEQLRDDLCELAGEVDTSRWLASPAKSQQPALRVDGMLMPSPIGCFPELSLRPKSTTTNSPNELPPSPLTDGASQD